LSVRRRDLDIAMAIARRRLAWCAMVPLLSACAATAPSAGRIAMPAEFRYDRVFVVPRTVSGETITFYTDSGGGWNAIGRSVVRRLALKTTDTMVADDRSRSDLVDMPVFAANRAIPAPDPRNAMHGRLVVADDEQLLGGEGFLGGRWFAGKVWEFDYVAHTLTQLVDWRPPVDAAHKAVLGFAVDAAGKRPLNFARIAVRIDGETIDMLLDTGATATLGAGAADAMRLSAGTRVGTSFIVKSVFDRWVRAHPDWPVIADGDRWPNVAFPMILVPGVTIADQTVGPVWFTQRMDPSFRDYMSSMMDAPIEGAIGGSAFRYMRMVVDYPGAAAYFYSPN
jgi:hypothetical protein